MLNIKRNVMQSVKMNRLELLKIVKENAVKHVQDYDEAVQDYKTAVVKLAKTNLKLANSGELEEIRRIKNLPQAPANYADNYTRAIRMLELSVENTIDVEEHIFNQLVLDEWGWKQAFVAQSALYKSL
jgi:fibronectin type 3 domain-containing protein